MRNMSRRRVGKTWIGQLLWSVLGALIVGYFLYHTLQGERGLLAMIRMQNEVQTAESTLQKIELERRELQHRTQLLRSNTMDPDLLEEKSRELLNYSKPNEIIILTPDALNESKSIDR